jgi:hypothetical protein
MSVIPWWWKLLGAMALVGALAVVKNAYDGHLIAKGDAAGAARVQGRWDKAEAAIKADAQRMAAVDTARARAETAALQLKFDQLAERQQKDRLDHENDKRIAVAGALAGHVRLSIATAAGASGTLLEAGTVEGAGSGASAPAEARANLLPETAAAVLGIAGDYGQLVRDYNAVVERFDAVRTSCNAE